MLKQAFEAFLSLFEKRKHKKKRPVFGALNIIYRKSIA